MASDSVKHGSCRTLLFLWWVWRWKKTVGVFLDRPLLSFLHSPDLFYQVPSCHIIWPKKFPEILSTRRSESPSAGIWNGGDHCPCTQSCVALRLLPLGTGRGAGPALASGADLGSLCEPVSSWAPALRGERVGLNPGSPTHQLSDLQPNPSLPLGFLTRQWEILWFRPCEILLPKGWYAHRQHRDFLEGGEKCRISILTLGLSESEVCILTCVLWGDL